jgi:2-C-methyl-D-erythritol 4-phosphate cytidylyltransferase
MDTSAIIVCAGSSSRMNGVNKQFLSLGENTVMEMSIMAFDQCESVAEIIISARAEDCSVIENILIKLNLKKPFKVVKGGESRQKSVINALSSVMKDTELISVHDGARPLVSPVLIEKTISDARVFGAAVLGVPVKDTIKVVNGGLISDTIPRETLYITQTPQVFKKRLYFEGVDFALEHGLEFTDDCQLVEAIGAKVYMTLGDYRNIKITTPEDIKIAAALL